MTQTAKRVDPFRNFNFLVELDGIAQVSFMECSGLGTTTEIIELREGGDNMTVRKFPGKTTYTDIVLKWGMTNTTYLSDWRQQVIEGNVVLKTGAIVVFDLANSTEVARWTFVNAWPSKMEGPAFNARGNEIAINTLTISHEGIIREVV